MNSKREIIDFECPKCGCKQSYIDRTDCFIGGECVSCGELTFYKGIKNINTPPSVKCPYCNSTNTKKISGISKAGSVALFGIFAIGKATKQWHCNDCKSDF